MMPRTFMADIEKKSVLIAAVTSEMVSLRENLGNELRQHGFSVYLLPESEASQGFYDALEKYQYTIHLLSDHDEQVDDFARGLEEQQIDYAVQFFQNQKLVAESEDDLLRILAWHPRSRTDNIFQEEQLAKHINNIQQLEEVEFLRMSFEEFKSYLLNNLRKKDSPNLDSEIFIKGDNHTSIYFLFDMSDRDEAEKYVEYLKKRGFTVYTPRFDGDLMSIRKLHNDCLKTFDKAIIFSHHSGVQWVNMKIMDILKSRGLGREKEISGKAVFMSEEKVKRCPLARQGFDIIPFEQGISEDTIDVFISKKLF
jgi:hypothetical protein